MKTIRHEVRLEILNQHNHPICLDGYWRGPYFQCLNKHMLSLTDLVNYNNFDGSFVIFTESSVACVSDLPEFKRIFTDLALLRQYFPEYFGLTLSYTTTSHKAPTAGSVTFRVPSGELVHKHTEVFSTKSTEQRIDFSMEQLAI